MDKRTITLDEKELNNNPVGAYLKNPEKMETLHTFIYDTLFKDFDNKDVIIAGGFCRDTLLGFHFKDIDVFINNDNIPEYLQELCFHTHKPVLNRISLGHEPSLGQAEESTAREICDVSPFLAFAGESRINGVSMDMVNIKLLNGDFTPENLVKTFDANLVEAWYDPEEREIKCTDAFREGKETGVLKINDTGASYERALSWMRRNHLHLASRGPKLSYGDYRQMSGIAAMVMQPPATFAEAFTGDAAWEATFRNEE